MEIGATSHYAFIDESGTTSPFAGSQHLVIALLATSAPRTVELHVKRMQKKYGSSLRSGEMKASASREAVVATLLQSLVEAEVEVVSVIADKTVIARPPGDPEEVYLKSVALAVTHVVRRWPRLDVCLDKRYTTSRLLDRVEREIREAIVGVPQEVVIIRQEDSVVRKELQAADYVAWAIFQKYEHGDCRYHDIIAERVVIEEVVRQVLW